MLRLCPVNHYQHLSARLRPNGYVYQQKLWVELSFWTFLSHISSSLFSLCLLHCRVCAAIHLFSPYKQREQTYTFLRTVLYLQKSVDKMEQSQVKRLLLYSFNMFTLQWSGAAARHVISPSIVFTSAPLDSSQICLFASSFIVKP